MPHTVRASPEERVRRLPGDDLLPAPIGSATHAVTIERPPSAVWPWLAQMGADRAGWYSYDRLDNGGRPSAARIVPELQRVEPGMLMPWLPGATGGFTVLRAEADSHLVVGWLPEPGAPPRMTWAFVLTQPFPGRTRLLVRARAGPGYGFYGLPRSLGMAIARAAHFVMERRQLLGLARRAESTSPAGLP